LWLSARCCCCAEQSSLRGISPCAFFAQLTDKFPLLQHLNAKGVALPKFMREHNLHLYSALQMRWRTALLMPLETQLSPRVRSPSLQLASIFSAILLHVCLPQGEVPQARCWSLSGFVYITSRTGDVSVYSIAGAG